MISCIASIEKIISFILTPFVDAILFMVPHHDTGFFEAEEDNG